MKKRILSLFLSLVMILATLAGCIVTTNANETETTDIRDTWWADEEWRAEFNAWCLNYYTVTDYKTGSKDIETVFVIDSVAELYAFWRVSLDRASKVKFSQIETEDTDLTDPAGMDGINDAKMNVSDWTSTHFTDLNTYTEDPTDSLYATRFSFKLTADLDLQGAEWPGIAEFSGNFDGQGHTISNYQTNHCVTANSRLKHVGFFRVVNNTTSSTQLTIENLALKNATVNSNSTAATTYIVGTLIGDYCAAAADSSNGSLTVNNVMVDNVNVSLNTNGGNTSLSYVGGFIGGIIPTIDSSDSSKNIIPELTVKNCYFKGSVTVSDQIAKGRAGGFIGDATGGKSGDEAPKVTISNSVCIPTIKNQATAQCEARVWCARTNSDAYKNKAPTSVDPFDTTSTKNNFAVDTATLTTKPMTVPAGSEANWYVDEIHGVLPRTLAETYFDNYKLYAQLTPVAEGKYALRVVGLLGSLDFRNVTVDLKTIAADEETASATPIADWTAHETDPIKTVYTSIWAGNEQVSAESLGGAYIWCAEVKDLDATKPVTVRVTATKTFSDGTTQELNTYQVTVPVRGTAS